MRDPELSITGWLLIGQASTIRERVFARLVEGLHHDAIEFTHAPQQMFQIHPVEPTLEGLIYACSANTWARDILSVIPITRPARSALSDPELVPALQDLADILAWEATEAFSSDYYPGIPDIHVPDEHVELVMRSLQREMDREGKSRQRQPVEFATLGPDRQRALAERRRWWFAKFGITPERWQTGKWSFWEITDEVLPEMQKSELAL